MNTDQHVQIAQLAFGWMFYLWVAPMLLALVLLLRAERSAFASPPGSAAADTPAPVGARPPQHV